ncbi:hypothetical protein PISMIDRAFT_25221 [Pisolithus microcarpus 441]|uniref:Uncharacterized protein n=1 Tax=Pisolithus microcarpus 441 TaxID=765257 RepID=A0A0C9YPP3_9AGAM|nr:hypothetical protein BKA83DRAFT_25221 [Pisolithus microcarpus]KIK15799.1 hypothetical protein PISMIDRAFT_25221 [Pisolithus microcarpus 441]
MARTSVKAKHCTGGTAPRVPLSDHNVGVTAIQQSAPVNTQAQESASKDLDVSHVRKRVRLDVSHVRKCVFLLWCCNSCERVMCGRCITVPESFARDVDAPDVAFEQTQATSPYWGFYRDGKPVLSSWIKINRPFERSIRSRLLSHPTLVINLHLRGIPSEGPISMASQILAQYFPNGGFRFLDIEFDIGNDAKLKKYKQQVSRIISKTKSQTYRNVIIGLTNHSDSERGDLFIGTTKEGNPLSSIPSECLPVLLSPFAGWLPGAMFFLFSCGSVVSEQTRLVNLEDTITQLGFSSVIAFDAEDLQPVLTSNLVTGLIERVYIHGFPTRTAMPEALGESARLGGHSSVLLFTVDLTDDGRLLTSTNVPNVESCKCNGSESESVKHNFLIIYYAPTMVVESLMELTEFKSIVNNLPIIFNAPTRPVDNLVVSGPPFQYTSLGESQFSIPASETDLRG